MRTQVNCRNCGEIYNGELKKCPFCNTRTPLCWWEKGIIICMVVLVMIVGGASAWHLIEKVYKHAPKEEPTDSYEESNDSDDTIQDDPVEDNDAVPETETDLNEDKTSALKADNNESKSQEQKVDNKIPQNVATGVKTEDIVLPDFLDATDGLNSCKEYAPLTYVVLLSQMNKAATGYNSQFDGDYLLEVGGNTDRIMIYTYRMRFDFADVNGAKAKCEKYLDDNTDFIQSQLALYKKTMPEIKGIMVIFEHDESNLTLTSRTFK